MKTPEQLFDLYLKSVGRGANFLLNVPPDRRGLIHENDSASLVNFKKLKDASFSKNKTEKRFAVIKEDISKGQNVIEFVLQLKNAKGEIVKEIPGTTIGHKRIMTFAPLAVKSAGIKVVKQKSKPIIRSIELY